MDSRGVHRAHPFLHGLYGSGLLREGVSFHAARWPVSTEMLVSECLQGELAPTQRARSDVFGGNAARWLRIFCRICRVRGHFLRLVSSRSVSATFPAFSSWSLGVPLYSPQHFLGGFGFTRA
jgi:hypothetical protein